LGRESGFKEVFFFFFVGGGGSVWHTHRNTTTVQSDRKESNATGSKTYLLVTYLLKNSCGPLVLLEKGVWCLVLDRLEEIILGVSAGQVFKDFCVVFCLRKKSPLCDRGSAAGLL
jgi:hypothetical protein